MRQLARTTWTCVVLLLTTLGLAGAQGFGFSPTVMNINAAGNLATQTTMVNAGRTPARFTVIVRAWKMTGGRTVLEETRDVVVNPANFTLAPGASQVIRVGLRKKPGAQELTYRVFVQEVPSDSTAKTTAAVGDGRTADLNLAVAFSLPVYVTPPTAKAAVTTTVKRDGTDVLVTFANAGTKRATYNNLTALLGDTSRALSSFAVLAGAEVTVRIPGLDRPGAALTLTYRNADGQDVRETVTVP